MIARQDVQEPHVTIMEMKRTMDGASLIGSEIEGYTPRRQGESHMKSVQAFHKGDYIQTFEGVMIPDDLEMPYTQIIKIEGGPYVVMGKDCYYAPFDR